MTPQHILDLWFNGDKYQSFWFDQSYDEIIKNNYTDLLDKLKSKSECFTEWTSTLLGRVATIIVLDQFSRSIYRGGEDDRLMICDEIAYSLSTQIIKNGEDLDLPIAYRIFILMPYRHQRRKETLDVVIEKIKQYKDYKENSLVKRFLHATYQSYTNLDELVILYNNNEIQPLDPMIVDDRCLEYAKNSKDIKNIKDQSLYQTLSTTFSINQIVGVSLSGGVDSMVTLYLLSLLKQNKGIKDVCALHIEYDNDVYTKKETKLMADLCTLLSVPLFVRSIDYMSRDEDDRDFFENESKNVRFHSYRYLMKTYDVSGFCLGHHLGDVSENVMMNLFNGRDILDLCVMEKESMINGVQLFRPLLNHQKSEIYQVAYMYHIPYLKDTTPDWSCRGVLRRKLMPVMENQWGHKIMDTLLQIGNQSAEWNAVIELFVIEPIKKGIAFFSKKSARMTLLPMYNQFPRVIWLKIFLYIFHTMGEKMISRKNLDHFMVMFDKNVKKHQLFHFSNGYVAIFENDSFLIKNKIDSTVHPF